MLSSISEAIEDIKAGRCIIVVDDESRENEGDLAMAAESHPNTFHRQLAPIVRCFVEHGLIPDAARARFDAAIASAMPLRNSVVAELLLIVLVYGVGILVIRRTQFALDVNTWYASAADGRLQLTYAGWWGALVSMPLVQFLILRWFFGFFVWARFLWQVSRIDLNLEPTHPDCTAGLHFVALTERACRRVLLAMGVVLAGMIANKIFYRGATLLEFKVEIIGTVALLIFMILGPMLVFTRQIMAAKHKGIEEYGRLGQRYAREFRQKWIGDHPAADEPLIGSADIQSLADLHNAHLVVEEIPIVPFRVRDLLLPLLTVLLPLTPLLLTTFSAEELFDRLVNMLL